MMKRCSGALRRQAAAGFVTALLMLAGAPDAAAQEALYSPAELSTLPKIAAPGKVKSLIERTYPPEMKNRGIGGRVQVQFVVGVDGKVEPTSIKVMATTAPALADAAIEVAKLLEFNPGQKDGKAVRSQVLLPIVYSTN